MLTNNNYIQTQQKEIVMLLDNAFKPDLRVLKEASCLEENGYNITIFAWDRECTLVKAEKKDGISIERIRTKSNSSHGLKQLFCLFIFYLKIFPKLIKSKSHCIYCHDLLMLPMGVVISLIKKNKLIYDAHEIYWIMESDKYNIYILKLIDFFERGLLIFIDCLITVSEQRASYYNKFYHKPIYIVGNYYKPITITNKEQNYVKSELGIPENKPIISYIGGLSLKRDIGLLIDYAFYNKNIVVLIAGDGYWRHYIKESIDKLNNLIYLGWVSDPVKYYSASDIIYYVLSENHEYNYWCAPNNLYLSIALKIPIIVNRVGETCKIVEQNKIGFCLENRSLDCLDKAIQTIIKTKYTLLKNFDQAQTIYNWDVAQNELKKAIASVNI